MAPRSQSTVSRFYGLKVECPRGTQDRFTRSSACRIHTVRSYKTPSYAQEKHKMSIVEVKVPQLSESVSEGTMLTWKKKPGDAIAIDEILIEIETDKVVLEVPAPAAGVLAEVIKHDGDVVAAEEVIAMIDTEAKAGQAPAAAAAGAAEVKPAPAPQAQPQQQAAAAMASASNTAASPAAAKI